MNKRKIITDILVSVATTLIFKGAYRLIKWSDKKLKENKNKK